MKQRSNNIYQKYEERKQEVEIIKENNNISSPVLESKDSEDTHTFLTNEFNTHIPKIYCFSSVAQQDTFSSVRLILYSWPMTRECTHT